MSFYHWNQNQNKMIIIIIQQLLSIVFELKIECSLILFFRRRSVIQRTSFDFRWGGKCGWYKIHIIALFCFTFIYSPRLHSNAAKIYLFNIPVWLLMEKWHINSFEWPIHNSQINRKWFFFIMCMICWFQTTDNRSR